MDRVPGDDGFSVFFSLSMCEEGRSTKHNLNNVNPLADLRPWTDILSPESTFSDLSKETLILGKYSTGECPLENDEMSDG